MHHVFAWKTIYNLITQIFISIEGGGGGAVSALQQLVHNQVRSLPAHEESQSKHTNLTNISAIYSKLSSPLFLNDVMDLLQVQK